VRQLRSAALWAGPLSLLLAAPPAWACPYCAGRSGPFGTGRALLMVGILMLPFALLAVVAGTVRSAEHDAR
jgi:hypothetical protein